MQPSIESFLSEQSYRVTKVRLHVFSRLQQASQPLSTSQLVEQSSQINKTSVYRTIEIFLALGIITSIPHGWKQRYELSEPFKPHHHHLHCTRCGQLSAIHSAQLESLIKDISDEQDFIATRHHFEISGLCNDCQSIS